MRKSADRGNADHGWLKTFHTFSFADYDSSQFSGFGPLRVINEDRVAPTTGFPTHRVPPPLSVGLGLMPFVAPRIRDLLVYLERRIESSRFYE